MSDRRERVPEAASSEDDEMIHLLRLGGTRLEVPAHRAARVRQTVHAHWEGALRRRAARRRLSIAVALLSSAAAVALVVPLLRPAGDVTSPAVVVVGAVDRVDGAVQVRSNGADQTSVRSLAPDHRVHAGEWVTTSPTARAGLRLTNGVSVRLDTDSRVRLASATVIDLAEGALYVDTGQDVTGLQVRTPFGTAHEIGTQFEVRLRDAALRVRVRTGIVELRRENDSISARPGTELTVTNRSVVSGPLAPFGPEWEWIAGLAPAFEIDGQPLASFLDHVSHERGWTVRYGDPNLAREASTIILHGSVQGLAPHEALAVVLTTSGLEHRLDAGELVVFRGGTRDGERP